MLRGDTECPLPPLNNHIPCLAHVPQTVQRAGITITTATTQVTFPRKRFRSAHAAHRAWSTRLGPRILLMLPQLDQDLEQQPVSLQPADDELKIGREVMPVNIATPSDGTGR